MCSIWSVCLELWQFLPLWSLSWIWHFSQRNIVVIFFFFFLPWNENCKAIFAICCNGEWVHLLLRQHNHLVWCTVGLLTDRHTGALWQKHVSGLFRTLLLHIRKSHCISFLQKCSQHLFCFKSVLDWQGYKVLRAGLARSAMSMLARPSSCSKSMNNSFSIPQCTAYSFSLST